MIIRTCLIALLFSLCLWSCSTTKPEVWIAQDASLGSFKAFEIQPVFNATGTPIKQEILAFLTAYLREQFALQHLQLSSSPEAKSGILVVQNDILLYETFKPTGIGFGNFVGTGANRRARCKIRTRLVDKSTNKVVAAALTTKEAGLGAIGYETQEWFLRETAAMVAKEVAGMMQPK